ncbi:putative DNA binding domain-containing protein [Candidatus Daviesbacteria bacterium]|nr:putative DNA binding domain-containing protein [Candidatus Daviesbacteria bacterium]
MRKIDEQALLEYLQMLKEEKSIEFKSSFDWHEVNSRKIKEEVIKAIIAMSNIPNGGVIILGIKEDNRSKRKLTDGITLSQIDWIEKNFEQIESDVHTYCSEYPKFEFVYGETDKLPSNKLTAFVLIFVKEFSIRPVICKTTGKEVDDKGKKILLEGDLYTRSYSGGWSSKKAATRELE